jgi:Tol biopolymer transport system component
MKQSWYLALGLAVATICNPLVAGQTQSAQVMLEAARKAETIDGNPKAAIAHYEQIVKRFANDRAVVADALVRMAGAYRKLGDAQAKAIYERVVREYGDQASAVTVARAALSSAGGATAIGVEPVTALKRVWSGPDVDLTGSVSPDGRYLSYTDWGNGDLAIRNLQDGTARRLTDKGSLAQSGEYAERSVFSPDGRMIVYGWASGDPLKGYHLRVVDLSAPSAPPRRLLADLSPEWVAPYDWSADGRWIAVMIAQKDKPDQVGLIDVESGALHSQFVAEGVSAIRFTPDSRGVVFNRQRSGSPIWDILIRSIDDGRESRLVGGGGRNVPMAWSPDGGILFASNRGGSQGLWLQRLDRWSATGVPVLLKGDVGMRPLGITKAGALYIGATASDQELQVGILDPAPIQPVIATTAPVDAYVGFNLLPSWSRDGTALAFVTRRDRSRPFAVGIRDMASGQMREISPRLTRVNFPRWSADGSALYVQGADMEVRQGLFRMDAKTGDISTVALAGPGSALFMPEPSPDGRYLYFIRQVGPDNVITERELASGIEREVARASGNTPHSLSADGTHIAFVRRDITAKRNEVLVVAARGGEATVVHRLAFPHFIRFLSWLPGGRQFLMVIDNGETRKGEVALISTDGTPARIVAAPETLSGPIAVHPDGRQVAFSTGKRLDEVWVLENFLPPTAKSARK